MRKRFLQHSPNRLRKGQCGEHLPPINWRNVKIISDKDNLPDPSMEDTGDTVHVPPNTEIAKVPAPEIKHPKKDKDDKTSNKVIDNYNRTGKIPVVTTKNSDKSKSDKVKVVNAEKPKSLKPAPENEIQPGKSKSTKEVKEIMDASKHKDEDSRNALSKLFEVGRSKSQLDNPFTADQLESKKALVIKPDIDLTTGGIKSKEVRTGVLVNSVLPYEAGGIKRPIPTVTQWLLYENQIHLHKLKMQDPYNHPDKGIHVEVGSSVDQVLCGYVEGSKILNYMMQMWLDNYFWSEGKSIVHDLPDPMSVPAIWRSTLWMFLRQFYSMKQVVRHDCPSIWLGYYLMCPENKTGTARIPSTLKDLK
ncbi:hypothetical protein B484DRAFT_460969, partial [Ochromonadaceae sp. CCMP2298]